MTHHTRVAYVFVAFALAACHHQAGHGTNGDGGNNGNGDGGSSGDGGSGTCDLRCRVNHSCANNAHTTLTGKVYAPNGTLPLYNAAVYVPNGTVAEFANGVSCQRCDGSLSGDPVTSTLTDATGSFTLTDVPTGANVPLVIQLGRWRKQVTISNVPDCATTPTTATQTSLPKNQSEGHIPLIAIASGTADPLECLFVKLGIDTAEVTAPTGTGRIHFYQGTDSPGLNLSPAAPTADQMYSSLDSLEKYDVVMLPCEGKPFDKSQVNGTALNPDPRGLFAQYLNAGGRVFATHYSYDWLTYTNSPYNQIAKPLGPDGLWPVGQPDDYGNTIATTIVQTFPKGMSFALWLIAAGATSPMGMLNIIQGRSDLIGVDPMLAQPWATFNFATDPNTKKGNEAVMHMTFNTPLDAGVDDMGQTEYCGRVVFSDFHATADAVMKGDKIFPTACINNAMTDQEKALAFMLFDLSSCVQKDSTTPIL